jgi:hypothetical protein
MTRARAIAPATFRNKPTTPTGNPCNRPKPYGTWQFKDGHSYYIVEMRYTTRVEHGKYLRYYDGMKVQIMFCDYNAYQVGFRSYLHGKWSSWYSFSEIEFPLPFFLREDAIIVHVPGCKSFEGDYIVK